MNAVKISVFSCEHSALLNVTNLSLSEFRVPLVFASGLAFIAAVALYAILNIIGKRPDAEMIRIDTGRGVAGVQNTKPSGDCSLMQFVGNPVGQKAGAGMATLSDLAITLVVKASVP